VEVLLLVIGAEPIGRGHRRLVLAARVGRQRRSEAVHLPLPTHKKPVNLVSRGGPLPILGERQLWRRQRVLGRGVGGETGRVAVVVLLPLLLILLLLIMLVLVLLVCSFSLPLPLPLPLPLCSEVRIATPLRAQSRGGPCTQSLWRRLLCPRLVLPLLLLLLLLLLVLLLLVLVVLVLVAPLPWSGRAAHGGRAAAGLNHGSGERVPGEGVRNPRPCVIGCYGPRRGPKNIEIGLPPLRPPP